MNKTDIIGICLTIGYANGTAAGQSEGLLGYTMGTNIISPTNPTVELGVSALFTEYVWYAFAAADVRLTCNEPGVFGEVNDLLSPQVAGSIPGWPQAGTWSVLPNELFVSPGQPNEPGVVKTNHVLHLFSVTWTTTDFTPRYILFQAQPIQYALYQNGPLNTIFNIPNPVGDGILISVIPAPSSALALLAGAGLVGVRRRR